MTLTALLLAATITFPAHVLYSPGRVTRVTEVRLNVCPPPTTVADCAAGHGWIDPDTTSPVPGYWLRHVDYRSDGWAELFFCRSGERCVGDTP